MLLATASWGLSFVVIKEAIEKTPPSTFLFWRFALAAVVLVAWLLGRGVRPTRAAWRGGARMGLLLAGAYALQTWGLRFTGVSSSGFLTGLYVVFTPLCAALLGRRRPSAWTLGCAATAAIGLALMAGGTSSGAALGDALTIGCAWVFALHLLATERFAPHHDVAALNATQFVVAAAVLGGVWAADGPALPPASAWGAVAFTAVVCTVFGFGCQTWAQARMPATHAAVAVSLEAPFAALAGRIWLDEQLGAGALLGCALMFGAFVAIAARPGAPATVEVG
jgi:drug/metabolite transporter (DMT)-like permease